MKHEKPSSKRGAKRIALLCLASSAGCGRTRLVLKDARVMRGNVVAHDKTKRSVKVQTANDREAWVAVDRVDEVHLPGGGAFIAGVIISVISYGLVFSDQPVPLPLAIPLLGGLLGGPGLMLGSAMSSGDDQYLLEKAGWQDDFNWTGHSARGGYFRHTDPRKPIKRELPEKVCPGRYTVLDQNDRLCRHPKFECTQLSSGETCIRPVR